MSLSNQQLLLLDNLVYLDGMRETWTVEKFVDECLNDIDSKTENNPAEMSKDEWISLLEAIKKDKNLCGYKITNYENGSNGERSACFVDNTNNPIDVNVIFRGTAGDYEWHDNGNGAYVSDSEQQNRAAEYINNLPDEYGNNITVSGHSKGGNKSQYVTIVTDRIGKCLSFDGQGFSPEFIKKYRSQIADKKKLITSISAKDDYVNGIIIPIAGTIIFIDNKFQKNYLYNHKPNIIFDDSYNLRAESQQSEKTKFINEYTTYIVENLNEPEKSYVINGLIAVMEKGNNKEDMRQTIIAGGLALSHLDDFAFDYIGEHYGIPAKLLATSVFATIEPILFFDDKMEAWKDSILTLTEKAAQVGNKIINNIIKLNKEFMGVACGKDILLDEEAFIKASEDLVSLSEDLKTLRNDIITMLDTLKKGFDTPAGTKFYNSCNTILLKPLDDQKLVIDHVSQVLLTSKSQYQSVFDAYSTMNNSVLSYSK